MNKKDGMGNMRKIGMLLVALMLISIILLSGSRESSNDSNENNEADKEYSMDGLQLVLSDASSIYSSNGYEDKISINFALDDVSSIHDCKMNKLTYTLYGNGHYVGGSTIDYIRHAGDKAFTFYKTYSNVYFHQYLEISYTPPELRRAIENMTTIQWKASGELSVYTPDDSTLLTLPFEDLTYYETFEEWK